MSLNRMISRDELIIGPLSLKDDRDSENYSAMVQMLRDCRRKPTNLTAEIKSLSRTRRINYITMGNYTRFPIAVLKWTNWVKSKRDSTIYGRSVPFLELTLKERINSRGLMNVLIYERVI